MTPVNCPAVAPADASPVPTAGTLSPDILALPPDVALLSPVVVPLSPATAPLLPDATSSSRPASPIVITPASQAPIDANSPIVPTTTVLRVLAPDATHPMVIRSMTGSFHLEQDIWQLGLEHLPHIFPGLDSSDTHGGLPSVC
ncbi:hypothetical protein Dimus_015455 [Dionaea muscipula]